MKHIEIFNLIEQKILNVRSIKNKVLRIAINGIEGTGKTVFTEKLTKYLFDRGYNAIHISIDGFHNTQEIRYRQGIDSYMGYYEDAYNENEFIEKVLLSSQKVKPFITKRVHDIKMNTVVIEDPVEIPHDSIILTDGAYLFKESYKDHWDIKIYLKTDFQTAEKRGIKRDNELLGGEQKAKEKYESRYHRSSKYYIENNKPEEQADMIIDNTDFENLIILKE